jgi:hypothetical protein
MSVTECLVHLAVCLRIAAIGGFLFTVCLVLSMTIGTVIRCKPPGAPLLCWSAVPILQRLVDALPNTVCELTARQANAFGVQAYDVCQA